MSKVESTEVCPKCNGVGYEVLEGEGYFFRCSKCAGHGKLDWIEKVVGPRKELTTFSLFQKYMTTKSFQNYTVNKDLRKMTCSMFSDQQSFIKISFE